MGILKEWTRIVSFAQGSSYTDQRSDGDTESEVMASQNEQRIGYTDQRSDGDTERQQVEGGT